MHTTHRNTQYKNEFKHSEMGPVRQNPIQRTVSLFICLCISLCTIVAHNIAQNRPDSFPPYPPDDHHCSDDVYLREGGTCNPPDHQHCSDRRKENERKRDSSDNLTHKLITTNALPLILYFLSYLPTSPELLHVRLAEILLYQCHTDLMASYKTGI